MASKGAVVIAANLNAHGQSKGVDRAWDVVIWTVVIGLPESGFVRDVDLAIGMEVLTIRIEEEGRVQAAPRVIAHDDSSKKADTAFGRNAGLQLVMGSHGRLGVFLACGLRRWDPRQHGQFRQHGQGRPSVTGFEQVRSKSVEIFGVREDISNQGDRE